MNTLAAEDLPHIFKRFFRADKSRARVNGSSGLGLAISKAIVDAHGGSIEVSRERGKGTVVTLRLPAAAERPEAADRGLVQTPPGGCVSNSCNVAVKSSGVPKQ